MAGTKGKGTTCHYCNLLLQEYQRTKEIPLSIGCYTTPHLAEVRERIQINFEPISKELFTKYFQKLWNEMQSLQNRPDLETPYVPEYSGFLTLLAIYIFNLESIDVAIIETGVGGERDSTNVFRNPTVTGITKIDFDHVERLQFQIKSACPAFSLPSFLFILHPFLKCNMPKKLILAEVFLFFVLFAAELMWAMVELIQKSLHALWLGIKLKTFLMR